MLTLLMFLKKAALQGLRNYLSVSRRLCHVFPDVIEEWSFQILISGVLRTAFRRRA